MPSDTSKTSRDWLCSPRISVLAWGLPAAALIAGLLASVPARTVIWTITLIWMGTACILNAKGCGRTHCRYTGPYYLMMIAPVAMLGTGLMSAGIYAWLVLACVILLGTILLWWMSERAWGRVS